MKIRLVRHWEQLRGSYWLIPGVMALAAALLAGFTGYLDWAMREGRFPSLSWLYVTGPSGARAVLSTLAGSAIGVAGLIFSITIVVLNMASAQFGPRLLRNFMEHGGTQLVLGTYVGTFIYCLLVLSAVRSEPGHVFVPHLSVTVGLLLGVLSFAFLIYFIHHVALFIQAPRIIDDVAKNLEANLRQSFPERTQHAREKTPDEEEEERSQVDQIEHAGKPILAAHSGYIQAIDLEGLVGMAQECELVVRLLHRPGHFVISGHVIAYAVPANQVGEEEARRINGAFLTGSERTPTQDPEFAVHQLVEVALRALSPGINDPFTALNCVDRLGAALAILGERRLPSRYLRDNENRLRIITEPYTYTGVVDAAFNQIRQSAAGNMAVTLRLLETIATLAEGDLPKPHREALREQAEAIHELNRERPRCAHDQSDLEAAYRRAQQSLEQEKTTDKGIRRPTHNLQSDRPDDD